MARARAFLLPFAGGSGYSYRALQQQAPSGVEIVPVELPGRGMRIGEPLLTDLEDVAEDVLTGIEPRLDLPYLLFGHSMGALLAWLVARLARRRGLRLPGGLVLSGMEGPAALKRAAWHAMPRADFRAELRRLGGSPAEVLEDDEVFAFFEPIIRTDFQAVETFTYRPEAPLDVPLTVLLGEQDMVSAGDASAWQRESTHPLRIEAFPGDHFFIFNHAPRVGRLLAEAARGCGRQGGAR